jgi:hypothetical protein
LKSEFNHPNFVSDSIFKQSDVDTFELSFAGHNSCCLKTFYDKYVADSDHGVCFVCYVMEVKMLNCVSCFLKSVIKHDRFVMLQGGSNEH